MQPCILPWINFSTNPYGRPRVCGYSDMNVVKRGKETLKTSDIPTEWNNEYFKTIRSDFMNGRWPENCSRCKYVEELGGTSKRMDENFYYDTYANRIKDTEPDGTLDTPPSHIDIRTGTTCNQKCIHCGTSVSSKWREDELMFDKYPNTERVEINDRWIDTDSKVWNYLLDNKESIKRYNFLGGESFANKQHNKFLKELSESEYAKGVTLQYVTNGTLLTEERIEQLAKFGRVHLRLSVDALGKAGEYFRFPVKMDEFLHKVKRLEAVIEDNNYFDKFDVGFQWTCSNISMFYLSHTYEFLSREFIFFKFIFSNHVEFPVHMSAQNLPLEIKNEILKKIESINLAYYNLGDLDFYVNHMMEKDLWQDHKTTLHNYLDDLDKIRGCDWKESFKEMELEKYFD